MVTKHELLNYPLIYDPEEIAQAIRDGVITLDEFADTVDPLFVEEVKDELYGTLPPPPMQSEMGIYGPSTVNGGPAMAFEQQDIPNESPEEELVDNHGMFRRPFSFFKGRIRRTEYWLSLILFSVCSYLLGSLLGFSEWNIGIGIDSDFGIIALCFLYCYPGCWFYWAQGSKRCHDLGVSGWFQIVPFYVLWMLIARGDIGDNQYGTDPRE